MKKVSIEIVKAQELDPRGKYIIELPNTSYTMEDAHAIATVLKSMNVDILVAVKRGEESFIISKLPALSPEVDEQKPSN